MLRDEARLDESAQVREINRRTIAKGVAWTVPAIIVATAAPAAAASGDLHINAVATLGALEFNNDSKIDFEVYSHGVGGSVTISGVSEGNSIWKVQTGSTVVAANGKGTITLVKKKGKKESTVIVTYSYTPTGGATVAGLTQSVFVPATP